MMANQPPVSAVTKHDENNEQHGHIQLNFDKKCSNEIHTILF